MSLNQLNSSLEYLDISLDLTPKKTSPFVKGAVITGAALGAIALIAYFAIPSFHNAVNQLMTKHITIQQAILYIEAPLTVATTLTFAVVMIYKQHQKDKKHTVGSTLWESTKRGLIPTRGLGKVIGIGAALFGVIALGGVALYFLNHNFQQLTHTVLNYQTPLWASLASIVTFSALTAILFNPVVNAIKKATGDLKPEITANERQNTKKRADNEFSWIEDSIPEPKDPTPYGDL